MTRRRYCLNCGIETYGLACWECVRMVLTGAATSILAQLALRWVLS
jgi:hypothetical protein